MLVPGFPEPVAGTTEAVDDGDEEDVEAVGTKGVSMTVEVDVGTGAEDAVRVRVTTSVTVTNFGAARARDGTATTAAVAAIIFVTLMLYFRFVSYIFVNPFDLVSRTLYSSFVRDSFLIACCVYCYSTIIFGSCCYYPPKKRQERTRTLIPFR